MSLPLELSGEIGDYRVTSRVTGVVIESHRIKSSGDLNITTTGIFASNRVMIESYLSNYHIKSTGNLNERCYCSNCQIKPSGERDSPLELLLKINWWPIEILLLLELSHQTEWWSRVASSSQVVISIKIDTSRIKASNRVVNETNPDTARNMSLLSSYRFKSSSHEHRLRSNFPV